LPPSKHHQLADPHLVFGDDGAVHLDLVGFAGNAKSSVNFTSGTTKPYCCANFLRILPIRKASS
jgi:hypothetical protein